MTTCRTPRHFVALVACLALTACDVTLPWSDTEGPGPGGGGGGGSPPVGTFAVTPARLELTTRAGTRPPDVTLHVSLSGTTEPMYLGVTTQSVVFDGVDVTQADDGANIRLGFLDWDSAADRHDQVGVYVCADRACARPLAGSPTFVPVTVHVRDAQLTATPSAIAEAWTRGSPAPAAVTLAIAEALSPATASAAVSTSYDGDVVGWLTWRTNGQPPAVPGSLEVSVVPSMLPPGVHTGRVTVRVGQGAVDVPVSVTVSNPEVNVSPAGLTFAARSGAPASGPAPQEVTVEVEGASDLDLVPSVDYGTGRPGWLVTPSTFRAPGTLTLRVATTLLPPGSHHAAVRLLRDGFELGTLDVVYDVAPTSITASPEAVSLSLVRHQSPAPPAATITLTTPDGHEVPGRAWVQFPAGVTPWLWDPYLDAPGTLSLAFSRTDLPPGEHGATLMLANQLGVTVATVPVTCLVREATLELPAGGLSFAGVQHQDQPPPMQSMPIHTSAGVTVPFVPSFVYGVGARDWLEVVGAYGAPGTLQLRPTRTDLEIGSYEATVNLLNPADGSVLESFPVRYDVAEPPIRVSSSDIAFSGIAGQVAPPPAVEVTLTTGSGEPIEYVPWVLREGATYLGLDLEPQSSGTAPGVLRIRPDNYPYAAGRHAAVLRLASRGGATLATLRISYTVAPLRFAVSPASLLFDVTATTTPGDLAQALALRDGGTPTAFSVSHSPALTVTPESGMTPGASSMRVEVPLETVLAWNGQSRTDTLYFSATPEGASMPSELRVEVRLDLHLPAVKGVAPWVIAAGDRAPIVVRGTDLGGIPPGALLVGGAPAEVSRGVNPENVLAVPPALAPGRHAVSVRNELGLDVGGGWIEVVASGPAAAASGPSRPGDRARVIRDDVRGATYAANRTGYLERWRDADGYALDSIALPGLDDVALSTDGAILLAVAGDEVWEIDPVTFLKPAAPALSLSRWSVPGARWGLAFSNDGVAAIASTASPGILTVYYRPDSGAAYSAYPALDGAAVAASRDGSRVLFARSGAQGIVYEPANLTWRPVGAAPYPPVLRPALDRAGTRILPSTAGAEVVLTGDYLPLPGRLPAGLAAAGLDDGGQRVVAVDDAGHVRVFDVSAPMGWSQEPFPELGTPGGVALGVAPGADVRVALSTDGRTLYVIGADALVVFPLP